MTLMSPNAKAFYCLLTALSLTACGGGGGGDSSGGTTVNGITLSNAEIAEGDSGSTTLSFNVTSSSAQTVSYSTGNISAAAGSDYTTASGSLTFTDSTLTQTIDIAITPDTELETDETFTLTVSDSNNTVLNSVVGTIINDDFPTVSAESASTLETDSGTTTLAFNLTLSEAFASPFVVNVATSEGSGTGFATAGSDFVAISSQQVTFAANDVSETVSVTVNGDTDIEPDESLNLVVTDTSGTTLATIAGVIRSDDLPGVSIPNVSVFNQTITEGNSGTSNMTFTVQLDSAATQSISMDYATSDNTATAGSDYSAVSGTLTFAAGTTSQTITVPINGDTDNESSETFNLLINNSAGVIFGQVTGTITNDDSPSVSVANIQVNEGDSGISNASFVVNLGNAINETVTLNYITASGSGQTGAQSPSDFTSQSSTIVFAPNTTQQTVDIPVSGDTDHEANETFTFTVLTSDTTTTLATATATIVNDDIPAITITDLNTAAQEVDEGANSTVTFQIDLATTALTDVTLNYTTADGSSPSATANVDYQSASGTITFPTGSSQQTVQVTVIGDNLAENDEFFDFRVTSTTDTSTILASREHQITNEDTAGLSVSGFTVNENAGTADFVIQLGQIIDTSVDYTVSPGTAILNTDYSIAAPTGNVSFTGGSLQEVVTVTLINDDLVEAAKNLSIEISNPDQSNGPVTLTVNTATGTINSEDQATVSIDDVSTAENAGPLTFTANLDKPVEGGFTVNYAVAANGTATGGTDFTTATGTLTFADSSTTAQTVNVTLIDDNIVERDETLGISLNTSSSSSVIITDVATGTITNDDVAIVSIANVAVTESAGTIRFTAQLDKEVDGGFSLNYTLADGTATGGTSSPSFASGIDYDNTGGSLNFNGTANESIDIDVTLNNDNTVEQTETFTLNMGTASPGLSGVATASINTSASATGSIENDDSTTVSVANASLSENDGSLAFVLTLNSAVTGGVTLEASTVIVNDANPNANALDFTAISNQVVSFNGVNGEQRTVNVSLTPDSIVEFNETFELALSNFSVTGVTSAGNGTGTINNDDTASLTIEDVSQVEDSNANLNFIVTLNGEVQDNFSVDYALSNGTATGGTNATGTNDFSNQGNTITFSSTTNGATQNIVVPINNDTLVEADETFTVAISNPVDVASSASFSGVIDVTDQAQATLTNDDATALTISNAAQSESTGQLSFNVTLGNGVDGGFSVNYGFADVSATGGPTPFGAGVDYDNTAATLNFSGTSGEVQTINVDINNDNIIEETETFTTSLSNLNAGTVANSTIDISSTGTGSINNDDTTSISISNPSVAENGTSVDFTLTLNGQVSTPFTADASTVLRTSSSTANANASDFTQISNQTVSFTGTSGETRTVTVTISNDNILELDELFELTLGNISNSNVTLAGNGVATITNDDSASLTIENVSQNEDSNANVAFVVTLNGQVQDSFNASYSLSNGTATGSNPVNTNDFDNQGGTVSFPAGSVNGATQTINVSVNNDTVVEADETFSINLSSPVDATLGTALSTLNVTDDATATLVNDDQTTLAIGNITASETAGNLVFTVTSGNAVDGGFTVEYDFTDISATGGTTPFASTTDYLNTRGQLSFSGTANEQETITVQLNNDDITEADETFSVAFSNTTPANGNVDAADIISTATATGTITSEDTTTVSINSPSINENTGTLTFVLTLNGTVSGGFTVDASTQLLTGGDNAIANDFTQISNQQVSFTGTSGQTRNVVVTLTGDSIVEPNETFALSLSNFSDSNVSSAGNGTGTISNDDSASLTVDNVTQDENTGDMTFTVTLNGDVQDNFSVDYSLSDGTATGANPISGSADYNNQGNNLSFTTTTNGTTASIVVPVASDTIVEADETFTVALSNLSPALNIDITDNGTGTIRNDDQAILTIDNASASETAGTMSFNVSIDAAVQGGFSVPFSFTDVSATGGSPLGSGIDYNNTAGTLNFAGDVNEIETITVSLNNDDLIEATETYTVALGSVTPVNNSIDSNDFNTSDQGTGTITSEDTTTVSVSSPSISESTGTLTFTLTLNGAVSNSFTLDASTVLLTGGDNAIASDIVQISNQQVSFTGTSGQTRNVSVTLIDDAVVEPNETFALSLSNFSDSNVSSAGNGTGTISNDDSASLTIDNVSQDENTGDMTFTVTLNGNVQDNFSVDYSLSDGTATGANPVSGTADYNNQGNSLSFTTTTNGTTASIVVPVASDAIVEADETFTVALSNLSPALNIDITDNGTGTIRNDDQAVLMIDNASASETAGTMSFNVSIDAAVQGGFSVPFSFTDVSATGGSPLGSGIDYNNTAGTLNFAGDASEVETITVSLNDDNLIEIDETYTVALGNVAPTNSSIDSNDFNTSDQGTGTITSDDTTTVSVSSPSVNENSGTLTFTLTLNGTVSNSFTLDASTVLLTGGDNAIANDFTQISNQQVSFTGTSGQTRNVTVTISPDSIVEADETFALSLSNFSDSNVSSAGNGTGTITNDDSASLTVNNVSQNENTGDMTFTVTLNGDVQDNFSVDYSLSGGTATGANPISGSADYNNQGNTLNFTTTSNGTTASIVVPIASDTVVEADETFTVALSNLSPSLDIDISDNGTGTIGNDDQATLTVDNASASETAGNMTINVSIDAAVQGGFSVPYSFTDGSATGGSPLGSGIDYNNTAGTLNFAGDANETETITVPLNDDNITEADETYTVSLGSVTPSNGSIDSNDFTTSDQGTGTITSEDTTTISIDNPSASESTGTLTFTLTLNGTVGSSFTLDASTVLLTGGNNAIANDFTQISDQQVSFTGTSGQTRQVQVTVTNDNVVEFNETLGLSIGNISIAGISSAGNGTGTITNDDSTSLSIGNASLNENSGNLEFTVTLNGDVQEDFSVPYTLADGSATGGAPLATGDDYNNTAGSISFTSPSATDTRTISVPLQGDTTVEADETFIVTLGTVSPALNITSGASATGTITNDDQSTLTITNESSSEGSSLMFTVSPSNDVDSSFSVAYSFSNVSASNTDYDTTAGSLSFTGASTQSQVITVSLTDDNAIEATETFTVNLGTVTPISNTGVDAGDIVNTNTGTGTINDNDALTVNFSAATYASPENTGGNLPVVTYSGASSTSSLNVTVALNASTDSTSASNGSDYSFTSPTVLTIPAGDYTSTAGNQSLSALTIINDTSVEFNETIALDLSSSDTAVTIGSTGSTVYSITNDDLVPVNDTNINGCATGSTVGDTCPQASFPNQDAEQTGIPTLAFTQLDTTGATLGTPATQPYSTGNWVCNRDERTGLTWAMMNSTTGTNQSNDRTYTWYNTDTSTNGNNDSSPGDANGTESAGGCDTGVRACNTQALAAAVNVEAGANANGLCGLTSGWRVPNIQELQSLIDYDLSLDLLNATSFPAANLSGESRYWSASPSASDESRAWYVDFSDGTIATRNKNSQLQIRLVNGQ